MVFVSALIRGVTVSESSMKSDTVAGGSLKLSLNAARGSSSVLLKDSRLSLEDAGQRRV